MTLSRIECNIIILSRMTLRKMAFIIMPLGTMAFSANSKKCDILQ
jgi:hypothetical protein